jgi:hypothetical protein
MTDYVEIENPKEIRRLHNRLAAKLKEALPHVERRGHTEVRFLSATGEGVFFSHKWLSKDKRTSGSVFGHGDPGNNAPLTIDIQFNFPVIRFSGAWGGAFLRHSPTNSVVLAHRGIVTCDHGHVAKADLLREVSATVREAETSRGIRKFFLLGELGSATLIGEIDDFSSEVRRAVKVIKARSAKNAGDEHKTPPSNTLAPSGGLRQYFDEFSGERQLKGRGKSIADCYHGTVVRAIRDAFDSSTETLKNQAIDLTVLTGKRVYLFEVKTSSEPQSIYTAIGQLTAHAPVVAKHYPRRALVKVTVVPERPNRRLYEILTDQLGIRLLTFARSAQGRITINGLKQLK